MKPGNDFWLNLHRLAQAYDSQGQSLEEREACILRQLSAMPRVAQREVLQELRRMAIHLPDLFPAASAAVEQGDSTPPANTVDRPSPDCRS
jgi:hypothetical protein